MKIKFLLAFCVFTNLLLAQHHVCGVGVHDQIMAEEKFARAGSDLDFATKRGDKIYLPVKFHIVTDNAGKGGISYNTILNQLARLNDDYAKFNFVFYLKDNYNFNVIKNNNIFNAPRDNEDAMVLQKDPKAINVFVVKTIGGSGVGAGIVLGYYSPTNDFVVLMEAEAVKQSNTLSHECGHFFNLRHTFFGWEANPYDENEHGNPVVYQLAPGTNVQVEKVDKSNCKLAADQLCDTPPDYNFGLTANSCVWGKSIKDINGELIVPMVNNQMSYFSDCPNFTFTDDQETRMRTNYANSLRNYLKSSYIPVTDTLPAISKIITPKAGSTQPVYTSVYFEWEDQKSTYYLLEIKNLSGTEYYPHWIKGANNFTATNLLASKSYIWTVRAFHDGYTKTASSPIPFKTGNLMVSTNDIESIEKIEVYPNPASRNENLQIAIEALTSDNIDFKITDITGRIIHEYKATIFAGSNNITLSKKIETSGIYLMSLSNGQGVITKKLIIQE